MNSLDEETVERWHLRLPEGYRIGFVLGGKGSFEKQTVNIRYMVGFERMVRLAIRNF